jgi:hypothetical protein
MHPDSVFQGVEMAHYWAYGAGFRASEYWDGPGSRSDFFATSIESMTVHSAGSNAQYGMRSPLFSGFFYACFTAGSKSGADYHSIVLPATLVAFSAVTALLPISVYLLLLKLHPGDYRSGIVGAVLVALHQKLFFMGGQPLVNSFISPVTMYALSLSVPTAAAPGTSTSRLRLVSGGALLGLVAYMRCDQLILLVAVFSLTMRLEASHITELFVVAAGFVASATSAGFIDYMFYGHWFASPVRWFLTNVYMGNADAYGVLPATYYFRETFWADPSRTVVVVTSLAASVLAGRAHWRTWAIPVCCFAVYSLIAHKEVRFVHDSLVFCLLACSVPMASVIAGSRQSIRMFGCTVLAVFVVSNLYRHDDTSWFRGPQHGKLGTVNEFNWKEHADINRGLQAVGGFADAQGVVVWPPRSIFSFRKYHIVSTAGWTLLHKRIPMAISRHTKNVRDIDLQLYAHQANSEVCLRPLLSDDFASKLVLNNSEFNYAVCHADDVSTLQTAHLSGWTVSARFGGAVVLKRGAESPNSAMYSTFMKVFTGWDCENKNRHSAANYTSLQDLSLPAALPDQWKSRESIATRNVNFARGASVRSTATEFCAKSVSPQYQQKCESALLDMFVLCYLAGT